MSTALEPQRCSRPILWRRDYEAAQAIVAEAASSLDDARLLALLRELGEYQRRQASSDFSRIVEWAEWVFIPLLMLGIEQPRRWSDAMA